MIRANIWQVKKGNPPFTQEGYEVTNGIESYWFKTKDWAWVCKLHFERLGRGGLRQSHINNRWFL